MKVIVIGAGIGGLAAAHRLAQGGAEVTVLERSGCSSGRMGTDVVDGFIIDYGAQFLLPPARYSNLYALLSELGLASEVVSTSPLGAVVRDGHVLKYRFNSWWARLTYPALSWRTKLRLWRVFGDMVRQRRLLDFHHLEKTAALDDESVADYLGRLAGQEAIEYFAQIILGCFFFCESEETSRAFFMLFTRAANPFAICTLRGGMSRLPQALADHLKVETGTAVSGVLQTDDGVRVEATGPDGVRRQVEADYAVVATTGPVARDICQDATAEEREFLSQVEYVPNVIVAMATDRPLGGAAYALTVPRRESPLLSSISFEHNKGPDRAPAGRGLLLLLASGDASRRLLDQPDEDVTRQLEQAAGRFIPDLASARLWSRVYRHQHAMPLFPVGYVRALARFKARDISGRRILFVGDYLGGGWTEAAITSGLEASATIIRRR